jgi:Ca-activated chloride channel homolog
MRINHQPATRLICVLSGAFFLLLASLPVKVNSRLGPPSQKALPAQARGDEQVVVRADLVSFVVTVTDSRGRSVADLDKSAFTVIDDKVKQEITYFSASDAPVSIGIIFDLSDSMSEDGITRAREALSKFFETSDKRDEYFLVGFNPSAQVIVDRTRDPDLIKRSLADVKPQGDTALFDGVRLGVEMIAKGSHPKRALLLISDGDENHSRYTFKEVRRMLEESDATLYSVWVWNGNRLGGKAGARIQNTLDGLSEVTGGKAFYPSSSAKMEQAFDQIALELRHQYSIGYRPSSFANDDRWHRVEVKVRPSSGNTRLSVRTRQGYYALSKPR